MTAWNIVSTHYDEVNEQEVHELARIDASSSIEARIFVERPYDHAVTVEFTARNRRVDRYGAAACFDFATAALRGAGLLSIVASAAPCRAHVILRSRSAREIVEAYFGVTLPGEE